MSHEPLATNNATSIMATYGKSLLWVLVMENPFHEDSLETHVVPESLFQGYPKESDNPETFLQDDDFLLSAHKHYDHDPVTPTDHLQSPTTAAASSSDFHASPSTILKKKKKQCGPNRFQKIIEMITRCEKRGLDVEPPNLLLPFQGDASLTCNQWHGKYLCEERLLKSPDGDEIYIMLHAKSQVLLRFAERQNIRLTTHPYSIAGGAAAVYTAREDAILTQSVIDYYEVHVDGKPQGEHNPDLLFDKSKLKKTGFLFDVPDKMRLFSRLLREGWIYGGCGIQVNEMQHKSILIKNFFPRHNKLYLTEKCLLHWGDMSSVLSCSPLEQNEEGLVQYFGEDVALYFVWLRKYTLFLRWLAAAGVVCAIVAEFISPAIVNGTYAIICVLWGISWCIKWQRNEAEFACRYNQEDVVEQEQVRDEFEPSCIDPITTEDIMDLNFGYPLSLQRKPDGTMVNLYYSNRTRTLVRYLVSYPIIILMTAVMIAVLVVITWWRFSAPPSNTMVLYLSSVCSVVTTAVFGVLFDKMVGWLNAMENNRTDSEEEAQIVTKSFFFNFFSFYFSLFIIALWPINENESDARRLKELQAQMVIICAVKPMVQNLQEIFLPTLLTHMRRRVDVMGGVCPAICSLLKCQSIEIDTSSFDAMQTEGYELWRESQREPFGSTAVEYLEITLQFGYMTMFAATFPWAAVCALFYNILELRVDSGKFLHICQRPIARPAKTIGSWNMIFAAIVTASAVTNAYLVGLISSAPSRMTLNTTNATTIWKFFVILQYLFFFVAAILFIVFSGTPTVVRKTGMKRMLLRNRSVRERIQQEIQESRIQRALLITDEGVVAAPGQQEDEIQVEEKSNGNSV